MERPTLLPGRGPKYRLIADQLIGQIRTGVLTPGERLPGERVFAKQLGLSVATVVAAVKELEARGYAVRRRGSGTYIANPEPLQRPRIGFVTEKAYTYCREIFDNLWTFFSRNQCDLLPLIRTVDQLESAVAEYHLDGLLVYNRGNFSRRTIQQIQAKGVPLLLLSAVQIGLLLGHDMIVPNNYRKEFFFQKMWEHRLPVNPAWVVTSDLEARLPAFLASPERPGAVIIGNGVSQPTVSRGIDACGLRVPEDLSVLVLDDYLELYCREQFKIVREYTRFRINVADFSTQAADYLLRRIRGENPEKPCVRNYEFVDAGTCRPPAEDSRWSGCRQLFRRNAAGRTPPFV